MKKKLTLLFCLAGLLCSGQDYEKILLGSDSVYTYYTTSTPDKSGEFVQYQIKDSMPDGKWIVYRKQDSAIAFIGYYKNSVKDSIWLIYRNVGDLMSKAKYVNGKLHGRYLEWYSNRGNCS